MHAAARLPAFRPPYGIIYLTSRVHAGQVVRRYIGQHKVYGGIVEDGYLGSGVMLTRAIKKFGREAFVREVLQLCYSRAELDAAEYEWVKKFNAVADPTFYNMVDGGMAGSGMGLRKSVFKFSLDGNLLATFESVAEAARIAGFSEAHMTFACKGTENRRRTLGGSVWRFEPEPFPGVTKVGVDREVFCYLLGGDYVQKFSSLTKAARSVGESATGNIAACCNGRKRSAGGFRWSYKRVKRLDALPRMARGQMRIKQIDPRTKETVAVFDSHTEAAAAVGASPANISRSTRSHYKTNGYLWESV